MTKRALNTAEEGISLDKEECSLCNSKAIVYDADNSEVVCSECGMVLHDNIESLSPEWRIYSSDDMESKSRTGMPTSLAFHDMGLSTYNYRKALDKHIIKGRSIRALVVASVYAACRELNVPRTLDEIADTVNADSIFAGKCYRLLVRYMKLHLPVIDSNAYLAKIANKARVSEITYRRGLEMLRIIKENPISHGKDPNALAVAVLYAACLKEGEKVSQAQIAVAGDTSIVTLRKRFQDVKRLFP